MSAGIAVPGDAKHPRRMETRQERDQKRMKLSNQSLFQQKAYINGQWTDADDGATFDVVNPATGAVLGRVPRMGAAETDRAIQAAKGAQAGWAAKTAKERADILMRWHDLMVEATEDLAQMMTAEQGKPLREARGEVAYAASFLRWFAEEARRVYGQTIPGHQADKRLMVIKQPVGVVAAITPWNFPAAMLTRKAGPALAAGCAMVAKPAEDTPFTALALAQLAEAAGVPAGVFNVVTGEPETIGATLTHSGDVRKLTFTGSTQVGRLLMRQSADTVKKISLELGGNAPFLVFDDADVDAAVDGAIASKFRNAGQTCVCANRVLVQDRIYDQFVEKLAAKAGALRVGPGTEDATDIGPLINQAALEKVQSHLHDATAKGAEMVAGRGHDGLEGTYFAPTVLAGATREMQFFREETFGPLAPVVRFSDDMEGVALANDTEFGLASYAFVRDLGRVYRIAEALESGIVGINTGLFSTEVAPFGGIKQSGLGREGAHQGIEEYLEEKYICLQI